MHPLDEQLKRAIQLDDRRDDYVLITNELIESYQSKPGGWTKPVLKAFGIAWPPTHGWKKNLVDAKKRIKKSDLPVLPAVQQKLF